MPKKTIHIRCSEKEKENIAENAKKTKRSLTGYVIYRCVRKLKT